MLISRWMVNLRDGTNLCLFQDKGKYDCVIQLLIIAVRGPEIVSANNLTNLIGI